MAARSGAKYAIRARQTWRIGGVVDGIALHLDGTVHADDARREQDVQGRGMFAAHVAVPTASVAVAERR